MTSASLVADVTWPLDQAASAATLLVAVEFDVLLGEPADRAPRGAPDRESVKALGTLADCPSTHAAVVSGRALADVQNATEWPASVELIGSHGLEWSSLFSIGLSRAASARLHWLTRRVDDVVAETDVRVERKPFGVSIHHRGTDATTVMQLRDCARAIACREDDIYVRSSPSQIDLSVAPLTNGWAIDVLRQRLPAPVTTIYMDTGSDEAALAALDPQDLAWLRPRGGGAGSVLSALLALISRRAPR